MTRLMSVNKKSELRITRRATAYSSSCLQVVLVVINFVALYAWSVRCSKNIFKNAKTIYFWGLRSFKVIDVNNRKKLVTSACYDKKQHVCAYIQPFLR